jgi:hypothetical protein
MRQRCTELQVTYREDALHFQTQTVSSTGTEYILSPLDQSHLSLMYISRAFVGKAHRVIDRFAMSRTAPAPAVRDFERAGLALAAW